MNRMLMFDYDKEPSRDILCIDCKSFYASCEAVERGLDPLTVKLVVISLLPVLLQRKLMEYPMFLEPEICLSHILKIQLLQHLE